MNSTPTELSAMINGTVAAYPDNKRLIPALKAIQWRLHGPNGEYVGLNRTLDCAFVPESAAFIFDGRDNEAMKLAIYQAALGPLTIEIIPQLA